MNIIKKRAIQFLKALFAKMDSADHDIVNNNLNDLEKTLFYQMDMPIQKHCVNVARTVITMAIDDHQLDQKLLIRASLLHDIGKMGNNLTLLDRILFVLIHKLSDRLAIRIAKQGRGNPLARLRNGFYVHCYHGEIGANLADKLGLDEKLRFLLNNHHDKTIAENSAELSILMKADEIN